MPTGVENQPEDVNARHNDGGIVKVDEEDLEFLKKWVKTEFFTKVKFIFNGANELKVGSNYYKMCKKASKGRLVGFQRKPGERNKAVREMYFNMLWKEATHPNRNLLKNGLVNRRSAIYTAMANKFTGKYAIIVGRV